ncbi:hypothetical protein DMC30DRAFT_419139 [Rhodotorula diobovata]|uniref:RING-type domain-containing protein n=1 Tax=Rhodotorula diobovata TaxID=5288 RepID=A0A5C5FMP1_9BASI|nr:hypothetical protein DMC30DRAFT_419139 [Rhodotorula diobovata]
MVHCPVDPGNSIQWAKAPAYTTQLVHQLSLLPTHDATHHLVFSQATRRSLQWKQRRQQALLTVTRALFSSGGDPFRERKQSESVLRRITTLGKEYSNHILSLKADPYSESTTLASIRQHCSYFDELHNILRGHPDFVQWEEGQAVLPANDDPMQDVRFAVAGPAHAPAHAYAAVPAPAAAQPAPAPAPIPHHPVAGPAYPNPILAAHYAAQAQAQDQAPVAAAAGAAAPDTPRSAAAQAALKRARDARSPSPPARAAPPPPAVAAAAAAAPPPPPPPQPAPAPAPAPASPPAPAAPAPGPAPAPAPAPADADDPPLSRCPKCSLLFSSLPCPSPAAEEAHLRQCLDAGGATVSECPVCGAGLEGLGEDEAARHVDECLFVCDEKTTPKDDKTLAPLECIMCFDEFSPPERLARLSCYCVFHETCIAEFWKAPGKFCPTHRELDDVTEVDMRVS